MAEYTSPVSFVWNKSTKKDGTQIIYCFAYVRHVKTNELLYAGVKYVGSIEKFGKIRKNLRNTAVMRLLNKPIYAIYVLKEGDKINEVLSKFFVYSSKKGKYANLGIHTGKGDEDCEIFYSFERDNYGWTGEKNDRLIRVKYGYESNESGMNLIMEKKGGILSQGEKIMDRIIALRRRAVFYGRGKERRSLERYMDFEDDYLMQFGILRNFVKKEKKILKEYHNVREVKYFKAKTGSRRRMHVAFMRMEEWMEYVGDIYNNDVRVNLDDLSNIYCVAYSMEDLGKVDKRNDRRVLHKKIVIDRMVENPTVVHVDNMDEMSMKDRRIWFFSRYMLKDEVMGRWSNFNLILDGEDQLWQNRSMSEEILVYKRRVEQDSFMDRFFKGVFKWIHSR